MRVYILNYMDNDFTTECNVFTDKLKALNAFHGLIESENDFLKDRELDAQFQDESSPEDDIYVATCFTDGYEGKIELIVKEIE